MILADAHRYMLLVLAGLALLELVAVLRSTREPAHQATVAVATGAGALSMAGRTVVTAGVIVALQWLVITNADHRSLMYWLALAVPALLAGFTLVRAFTVTTVIRRGGGRR